MFYALLTITALGGALTAFFPPLELLWVDGELRHISLDRDVLGTIGIIVLGLGGWALSLTLHEFGHAVVAYRGGDSSVADKGYLTMDVRHYADPVLSLVLPLLLLAIGGIPLPGGAVWINHWALRSRAVASAVSLAGPLSNLAIGVVLSLVLLAVPGIPPGLYIGLSFLAFLQILAFVLNIMPVPGLDGFGVLEPYLSPQLREFGAKARPWAPLVFFALLIAFDPVRDLFFGLGNLTFSAIGGDDAAAAYGFFAFQFWN